MNRIYAPAAFHPPLPLAGEGSGEGNLGTTFQSFPHPRYAALLRRALRAGFAVRSGIMPPQSAPSPASGRRERRWLPALVLIASFAHPALADERILDFHSDITVAADATMEVAETIRVRSEGDRIRHGIYRDFPTEYRDRYGNRVHVEFQPEGVTRDGADEPFHTEGQSNGVRVYFGSESTLLSPGEYSYVLRYRTTRQLGFFDDHDELYWNVTGNGWDFPIDTASAAVTLPDSVAPADVRVEAFTGEQGAKGKDYNASADAPSHAVFNTTRALAPREGLTIVVSFPKGIVVAPTQEERTRWFLHDNGAALALAIGLALLWLYYLIEWLRVGRDPKPSVIIPQYEAPDDFTPGALRHLERMGWDDRCVAADLVDLGVRGAIRIREDGGVYTIERAHGAREPLPPVERTLRDELLGDGSSVTLEQSENATINRAIKQHQASLDAGQTGRYYRKNTALIVIGIVITLVVMGVGAYTLGPAANAAGAGFMLLWLSIWSLGVFVLAGATIAAWRGAHGIGAVGSALFMTLFSLPFLAGELVGVYALVSAAGLVFTLAVFALIVTNVLFHRWIAAPTAEGRQLLDRIAGLRLYLGVAERDELATQKAPPMTAGEFQRFLPYALALGVEKTWADKFAAAVGPAAAAAAAGAMVWYQGNTANLSNISNFTSSIGSSLSGAISSSSTAPGSSSGGGGGGSSGGGGGGGGGGGW